VTRRAARELAIHLSFGLGVNQQDVDSLLDTLLDKEYYNTLAGEADIYREFPDDKQLQYIKELVRGISAHGAELDSYIDKYAKNWRISRISRVAVAIMRTAMYEVMYMPDVPDSAAISEAVELAKKYEDEETVAFINGILGSFSREEL